LWLYRNAIAFNPDNWKGTAMTIFKFNGKLALMAILLAAATVLGGCNTVEGMGKDVQKAGEKTQEAAQETSDKM
jgi:predicted small secreted protein